MKKEKNKEKDSKKKRYLSPSFLKGHISQEKIEEDSDDGDFKINLIEVEEEDDDESKSPSPPKKRPEKKKTKEENTVNITPVKPQSESSSNKKGVNALKDGHVKNVGSYSQAGKNEDGFTKVNQDSYLVLQSEYNLKDFNIFCVMDGHGVNGHLVSRYLMKYINLFFKNNKKMNSSSNNEEAVYYRLKKSDCHIIKKLFKHAERDIAKKSTIDANFSGTTCVIVFQVGEKLLCSNIGDSRAILVKSGNIIIPLSYDQKPNDPEESKRIIQCGGEISQYEEDGEKSGPYRVWKKGEVYPGIAMSRSIGDLIATTLGVIPEPKFIEEKLDKDSKFIVVASDGVWEFLDNERVAEIVMPYYKNDDPDGACKALIKESTEWWSKEDIVCDDITVVVVFF
jgi:serine/threonine protein phosphatase PrpC